MKRAVGYVRCSTDEQGSTSIPQQKAEIEKWARGNDFNILDWFVDEGKSGTNFLKRPSFKRMSEVVESPHAFDYVLVYDESRWGRAMNPRENTYWKMHFERHRVKVRIINSSSRNEDDIGSFVTEVVESAEASEYSKKLSRAVRRGMLSPQQGIYSRGGTAPYGYRRVAIDLVTSERRELRAGSRAVPKVEKVVWELGDPIEVQTVKRIFEMKLNGAGYVAIADTLNRENVPSPKRGRWRSKDQRWSGGTILSILQNKTYVGARVYNRLCFSKFRLKEKGITDFSNAHSDRPKFRNLQSEWIDIPDAHPPIVPVDLFEKANVPIRAERAKGSSRGHHNQHFYRSQFLLTGLIHCNRCHFNYQGHNHRSSGNKYYVDGGFINKGKAVCSFHSVRQDQLEGFVLGKIKELLLTPPMIQEIEKSLRDLYSSQATLDEHIRDTEREIAEIDSKIGNLMALAEKGVSLDTLAVRIKELEESKHKLSEDQGPAYSQPLPATIDGKGLRKAVRNFLENFEQRLQSVPMDEKKDLIRKVVEKIIVNRDTGEVECYIKRMPSIDEIQELGEKSYWVKGVAPTGIEPVFEP